MIRLSGSWCGVCPTGLVRLVDEHELVASRLETPSVPWWSRVTGDVNYVQCWSHETTGEIAVIGATPSSSGDIATFYKSAGTPVVLGKVGTMRPVMLRRREGKWLALIVRPGGKWELVDAERAVVLRAETDPRWSMTGLIGMDRDMKPIWGHPAGQGRARATVGTVTVDYPVVDGPWTAGQGNNPSTALVGYGQTAGVLVTGEARECQVVHLLDGRGAFVARVQGRGVAFAILRPSDVNSLPKPGTTVPTPPVDDEDDDMNTTQYNDLVKRLVRIEHKVDQVIFAIDDLPHEPSEPEPLPEPDPEEPVIPIESVTWLGKANPLGFAVTSHISTVTITRKPDDDESIAPGDNYSVCFPHSKAGQWPRVKDTAGRECEGNVCVIARIDGRWYGDTLEWLKPGQTCKRFSNLIDEDSWGLGPHSKHAPLETWGPRSDEWIAFFVCTPVRMGIEGPVQERSQLFRVRWP